MNVSTSSYSSMMQASNVTQTKQPSATDFVSKVMATSDIDGDSLLSIDELGLSKEDFFNSAISAFKTFWVSYWFGDLE